MFTTYISRLNILQKASGPKALSGCSQINFNKNFTICSGAGAIVCASASASVPGPDLSSGIDPSFDNRDLFTTMKKSIIILLPLVVSIS